MASNPKLDSSSSSPDGIQYGSQRGNYPNSSNLERSGNTRDGHDGRLGLAAGTGGGVLNLSPAGGGFDPAPLSQVLSLEPLTVDQRPGRHLELKRAINAAIGGPSGVEDPSLGSVQSKPIEAFGLEELKRVKASLLDCVGRAKEKTRRWNEAIANLERFRNSLQSRKRSRPESSALGSTGPSTERSLASLGVGERTVASVHNVKGSSNAAPLHASNADATVRKSVDKNKRVVPNKRVRTSLAETRSDGRPTNVNLQRSSVPAERDRDIARPSSSLASPAEDKERSMPLPTEARDKIKMKGKRTGPTTKPDSSTIAAANGALEGEREHKWSGQQPRMSAEIRSRASEGHGFRSGSGPVHGITSVHKAESLAQINGLPVRGTKGESECVPSASERLSIPERERNVSKNGIKPPAMRDESRAINSPGMTKTKAARAPRSSSIASGASHLGRSSSFTDNRERHAPPAKLQVQTQPQPLPGPTNRKRPAPSRSTSPPAQWVGQRPPKMARVARRVNLMPGAALVRDEPNISPGEASAGRDAVTPSSSLRPSPGVSSGSGVARRVPVASSHSQPSSKAKTERAVTSVGLSETDDSEDDGDKTKEKVRKPGDWEQKPTPPIQKMACLVVPAKKTRVVTKDEGGDGVRRQGRSGRGIVAPRASVSNPVEKVETSANAKQLRSVRVGPEKLERLGRPPTKKDSVDNKSLTRPRRPVGNGISEITVESDDDREELANAVRKAIDASEASSTSAFWKEMEPYFTFVTAADVGFLRQLARDSDEGDAELQIPATGGQCGKVELSSNTPPTSPITDSGGGKSMILANGNIEMDGFASKFYHNIAEKHDAGKGGKKGVSIGWFDKILPLSQRLLAALIHEGDVEDGRRGNEESCPGDSTEGFRDDIPFQGCISGSERMDGDSDGEIGRAERWTSRRRERYVSEGLVLPNGHHNHSGFSNTPCEDLGTEGDDIVAVAEVDAFSNTGQLEMGRGDEAVAGVGIAGKEDDWGTRSIGSGAGMTAWETQCKRMTVDDRILLELQSVGLLPESMLPDLSHREDDEISEELRKVQRELKEQVGTNKVRLKTLERALFAKKEKKERDRERFAVEKLVEIAYSKRMGSRGSAGGKNAAAKGAKTAGLAFAKRVLARVRAFEAGQSCFDLALRDILLCVTPKDSENSVAHSGGFDGATLSSSQTGEAATLSSPAVQPLKVAATLASETLGVRPGVGRADVKAEEDTSEIRQQSMPQVADHVRAKEDGWPLRAKEREVLLEDVSGVAGMRDVNALGANVMGGTKGKRSERERDGKGHGKESHNRSESAKGARQGLSIVKAERKTKTKPRQKTAPLLKAVNGLLAKPTLDPVKDQTTVPPSSQQFAVQVKSKEQIPLISPVSTQNTLRAGEEAIDLSHLPLPGMEDLGVNDLGGQGQDLGSWLQDFEEDPHMNQDGNCLMGLEVPMDDLSDLGLMM